MQPILQIAAQEVKLQNTSQVIASASSLSVSKEGGS
tara:strand:- start:491 stop:598 length:108 start_codon:yes stop_codon:yes gene_type:complete